MLFYDCNCYCSDSRRVLIVASGSRGDVQPYIAVGVRLAQRGYDVSVATEQRMKSLVEEYGLTYQFMEGDPTGNSFPSSDLRSNSTNSGNNTDSSNSDHCINSAQYLQN